MPKLKVYRTPIGFHDAYVAAPSQKAALDAWGAEANLFARGLAEVVDDPGLTAEPLARPGEVIRKLRGTAEEQIAALPPDRPKAPRPASKPARPAGKPRPPRPPRDPLEQAEAALADAEARFRDESAVLAAEERRLAERRRALDHERTATLDRLAAARDTAASDYEAALERWRKSGAER